MVHWKELEELAKAHRLAKPTASQEDLLRTLQIWWCAKYNRPFKDPLLQTYTIDELAYEYLTYYFLQPENDPKKKADQEKEKQEEEEWVKKQLSSVIPTPQEPENQPENQPKPEEIPDLPPDISTRFDG